MGWHARISVADAYSRRLTRDWISVIVEDEADVKSAKYSRRNTYLNEVWLESLPDLFNLVHNQFEFVTGSTYEGQCNKIGMEGVGTYTFPHGVVYKGQFRDGMFHGKGVLTYPEGQVMNCTFNKGKMVKWEFLSVFSKAIEDEDDIYMRTTFRGSEDFIMRKTEADLDLSTYCKMPDRRFQRSYIEGMNGAPNENLTNIRTPADIPNGTYDVGDGFYNTKTKWVHSIKNPAKIMYMIPGRRQMVGLGTDGARRKFIEDIPHIPVYKNESWILDNCRKSWDEAVGYKPELYEYWFTGRHNQRNNLNMRYEEKGGRFKEEESLCEESLKYFETFNAIKW